MHLIIIIYHVLSTTSAAINHNKGISIAPKSLETKLSTKGLIDLRVHKRFG